MNPPSVQCHSCAPPLSLSLSPYSRRSSACVGLRFGARRRVDIFPVSAGKYLQKEIKTSVRLCESVLSAMSLLPPPPLPLSLSPYSRRLSVCVGFSFEVRGWAYAYISIWESVWWKSKAWSDKLSDIESLIDWKPFRPIIKELYCG